MTWQPIETAPQDGTPFLAWDASPMGQCVVMAYWDIPDGDYDEDWEIDWYVTDFIGDAIIGFDLTHWMPIPAAPQPGASHDE
jgi:hypothetical protein